MKFNQSLLILFAVLMASSAVSAQDVSVDQLKQMIENSTQNLTTYSYSRHADTNLLYTNATIDRGFSAVKITEGKVDLVNQTGYWDSNLADRTSGQVLTWDGYLVNGTEYWKEGQNWTTSTRMNRSRLLEDYNEIPGEVNLIRYSNLTIVGSEMVAGEETYKLAGSPMGPIYRGMIGLQLLVAYIPSSFPLPEDIREGRLVLSRTGLMNNSNITLTAWITKDNALLKRLDINSSLTVSPQILNISAPNYMITSKINESTVYSDFGAPVNIELPSVAQNQSGGVRAVDYRWSLFGSVRP